MDAFVRERLHKIYVELDQLITELNDIMRSEPDLKHERDRARAYWLASLSVGLSKGEYCTMNPTFACFLEDQGIMDEDGNYIDEPDEEDEE